MATSTIKRQVSTLNGNPVYGNRWDYVMRNGWTEGNGYVYANLSAAKSIANSTWTYKVLNFTLTPGTWVIHVVVNWAGNSTGTREVAFTDANNSEISWGYQRRGAAGACNSIMTIAVRYTSTTTLYIGVHQSSGGALNLNQCTIYARRL